MRRNDLVLMILLANGTAAVAADDKPPLVLAPSSPWHVDYADDSCRLARQFGKDEERSIVYFERYQPSDSFFFVAGGNPLAGRDNSGSRIAFGPNGRVEDDVSHTGTIGEFGPAVMANGLSLLPISVETEAKSEWSAEDFVGETKIFQQTLNVDQEATIEWVEVKRKNRRPVRFELGSMRKPMEALRACTDELLTHWGIDLEAHRRLARAVYPKGNPGKWITYRDYPTHLLEKGAQGLVNFRLSVGADGNPTQCHVQQSTRPEGFDKAVCKAMMRNARFEPALDTDGNAIASYFRSTVWFEIPS